MRGTKAKAMRRYVEEQFPFLSTTPSHELARRDTIQVVLSNTCQRGVYQKVKAAYKLAKRNNTNTWRRYNEQ